MIRIIALTAAAVVVLAGSVGAQEETVPRTQAETVPEVEVEQGTVGVPEVEVEQGTVGVPEVEHGTVAKPGPESVPRTYNGSGEAFREGGRELGEGFRGLGRGIRDTFTGQDSRENYKETKNIGEGFKDIGRGVAGGARATGEKVGDAAEGEAQK